MPTGLHVSKQNILDVTAKHSVDTVQTFLSNPKSYTLVNLDPTWQNIGAGLQERQISLFVHVPYLINVVSAREDVRTKSVAALRNQMSAAQKLGAAGVIVHTGQGGKDMAMDEAFSWWEKSGVWDYKVPLLLENTAGGNCAPGRNLKDLVTTVNLLKDAGSNVGVCLDTCHAHAAGQTADDISFLAENVGGISLFHVNDSKDLFGSGRDRHQNLGEGNLQLETLANILQNHATSPMLVETPGTVPDQLADVTWIDGILTQ